MKVEYDVEYTNYQADRSRVRKFVRRVYLNRAAGLVDGPTLDFGCGVGELLARLPPGSRGLEYNKDTVAFCQSRGLAVDWYDGYADDWRLSPIQRSAGLRSMVISHVLEHLEEPMRILDRLLGAANDIGMERVLVIVPGQAGYRSDATHQTFVDLPMLLGEIARQSDWRASHHGYFPFNARRVGDWFTHNELQVLLQRD
jgi:SAM-dependent methyltransferase